MPRGAGHAPAAAVEVEHRGRCVGVADPEGLGVVRWDGDALGFDVVRFGPGDVVRLRRASYEPWRWVSN